MNKSKIARTAHISGGVITAIVLLMPFHAVLTVWLSQLLGHYTALRLWKEMLLVPLAVGAIYLVIKSSSHRRELIRSKLAWLIAGYGAVQLVWGIAALLQHQVNLLALGYGWVSDTRFLIFFLIVWIITPYAPKLPEAWPKYVFWPAAVVVMFGLLQYFILPYDFLTHLGYSAATIFPYEDINHNTHYIRIMSTLRGANPLGAYLLLVLSLLLAGWFNRERGWKKVALGLAGLLALLLTFSRSAWVGLAGSVGFLAFAKLGNRKVRKVAAYSAVACIGLAIALAIVLRHNPTFENVIFHTEENSAIQTTSNQGHASALQYGLQDISREPLGRGPGTAGPASIYNTGHSERIAENYFVQIAQETGWIGLGLFLAINLLAARLLWQRRKQTLSLGLLAALIGLTFVNLLSHAWADDTLAYLWWGLLGIALATNPAIMQTKAEQTHGSTQTTKQSKS